MNKLRKFLTVSVMGMSIIAMSGFGIGIANNANAAAQAGDLIKMDGLSSVYYLGSDGKRYVFPNEDTYFSWYNDFSSVVTIPASELQSYPLGANVTMRPGTKLVKITTDPSVYTVEPNGVLRKIQSEADAITLYGSNWAKRVVDVSDAFFTNYVVGNVLPSGQYPAGTLLKNSNDATVYYYDGSEYRTVASESAFYANRFSFSNVVTTSMSLSATGSAITGSEGLAAPYGATTGVQPGQGTGLSVSLAATTPATQDVPKNVAVPVMRFNVTASNDGDITVNGVKFTAIGLGNADDINGISVFSNNQRLNSSARDVDSNKEAQINFSNGVVVAKGTTATFEVRAEIIGTAKYGLSIVKASDVNTTATVSGSFPVESNIFSGVDVNVGELTIATTTKLADVKLGDKEAGLAEFKVSSDDVEDITLNAISFKKDSSSTVSDDDIENLKLYYDGNLVATAASIQNRYVTFTLTSPITITKNSSNKRLVIKGDVVDGADKTVGFKIDAKSDVLATGNHYGYQVRLIGGAFTDLVVGQLITVKSGEISIEKVNAVTDKIRIDADNVEAGSFKITGKSGKNIELSKFVLTINSNDDLSSSTASIENIELWDKTTNSIYDLKYDSTSGSDYKFKNDSLGLVMNAGITHELVVRFDTKYNATPDKYYEPRIASAISGGAAQDLMFKELGNDVVITDVTPNSVSLKKVTIQGSSAELSANALANITAVTGSTDVVAHDFNVKAGENSYAMIKDLEVYGRFATSTTNGVTNQTISELKLWKRGISTPLDSVSGSQLSGGKVTFRDLNEKIDANQTNSYYVTVSLVKNSANDGKTIEFFVSGMTVEDVDGKTIDVSDYVTDPGLATGRDIAMAGSGTISSIAMDNNNTNTKDDTYQIAGSSDVAVASVKLRSNNEDVTVTKMSIVSYLASTSEETSPVNEISEISLWDGSIKVASTNNIGATTTFSGLNFIIPQSEKTYTIKVKLNNYGKEKPANLVSGYKFKLFIDEAQGYSSGDSVSATSTAEFSQVMTLTGVKVNNVAMASSYSGTSIASTLASGIANNAAIIQVTAPDFNQNTTQDGTELKLNLSKVRVKVAGNAATTGAAISIERIGGSGSATSTILGADGYAEFALTDALDTEIASGQTAYYLVKVTTIDFVASTDYSLQVNLDNLNGTSSAYNFTWSENESGTPVRYDLRIPGVSSVDGIQITN